MGGCPVHTPEEDSGDDAEESKTRGTVGRRDFVKSALLIGGAGAVTSLDEVAGITTTVSAESADPITAAARLNRQHAWDAFEPVVGSGNTKPPENSMFLLLEYEGSGEPSPGHRRQVEAALSGLEDAFEWGPSGLLCTMAYSASYFGRFEASLPPGAAPDDAETVAETVEAFTDLAETNDDIQPDTADAMLLLASDNEANLLAAEAALWGDSNEISLDGTFEGVFEQPTAWPDRRVGFLGSEFQNRTDEYDDDIPDLDEEQIPDSAPLSMGFVAGFGASMPEEDAVTLTADQRFPNPEIDATEVPTDLDYVGEVGERDPGMFAQGTLKHFAHLEIDLASWYDNDDDRRRHQMYSPYHTETETRAQGGEKPGSGLVESAPDRQNTVGPDADEDAPEKTTLEYADETERTAAGEDEEMLPRDEDGDPVPTAGHSQKAARARYDVDGDGNLEQPVLRRDWDALKSDSPDTAGYLFNVPMRFNESAYSMLDANYNVGFTSLDGGIDHDPVDNDRIRERSGIAPFMTATRRGNWLVPPITLRALPTPRAASASLDVEVSEDEYRVAVEEIDASGTLDAETVQFGGVETVNQARGARPVDVSKRRGRTVFTFDAEDVALSTGDRGKLFAKTNGRLEPVAGTAVVPDAEPEPGTGRTNWKSHDGSDSTTIRR